MLKNIEIRKETTIDTGQTTKYWYYKVLKLACEVVYFK